jgi:lysophospholipase L1-like esterase
MAIANPYAIQGAITHLDSSGSGGYLDAYRAGSGAGNADISSTGGYRFRVPANSTYELRVSYPNYAPTSRTASVATANLPNFAALPYTSGYSSTQRLWVQKISVGFATQVNALASQGVAVVDLLCSTQFTNRSNFSSDGFHPNDAGYAALADAMMSAITSSSYPAPSGSCANMTIVK